MQHQQLVAVAVPQMRRVQAACGGGLSEAPSGECSERRPQWSTAAAVGGSVAAGVFLWARRNQISDQIGNLADQVGGWRDADDIASEPLAGANSSSGGEGRTQAEIAQEALTLKELNQKA